MGIEGRPLVMACCLALATAAATWAESKDLGRFGKVYPIVEPNLIEELQRKAPPVDLEQIRKDHETYQPKNLVKLPKTKADGSFQVDMTYTLDHDITDAQGNILYKKGFTFNPMEYVNFRGGFVVIDGSDAKQVQWFKATNYFGNKQALLLLTDGYAAKLAKDLHRPVFFLTKDMQSRLKLKSVPSIVVPVGMKLMVREVRIEEG
jgi:conjugal transfer pilus assembly protein TraW